jgi:hypothetical protein
MMVSTSKSFPGVSVMSLSVNIFEIKFVTCKWRVCLLGSRLDSNNNYNTLNNSKSILWVDFIIFKSVSRNERPRHPAGLGGRQLSRGHQDHHRGPVEGAQPRLSECH